MYAYSSGKKVVKFCDSSSDEEDSRKKCKRKSKKDKRAKGERSEQRSTLPKWTVAYAFSPGVQPIYVAPQPARPIFAAHIQMNPVVQPVVPCPMIAVTHTQLYPRPAMPSFGAPSTTYVLQAVNQAPAAVPVALTASAIPAAGVYSAAQSPFMAQSPYMVPMYTG